MPTARGPFWRNPGETPWRRTATDPPPAPPTVVEWLIAQPASRGERGLHPPGLENRAANGERADQVGPQLP